MFGRSGDSRAWSNPDVLSSVVSLVWRAARSERQTRHAHGAMSLNLVVRHQSRRKQAAYPPTPLRFSYAPMSRSAVDLFWMVNSAHPGRYRQGAAGERGEILGFCEGQGRAEMEMDECGIRFRCVEEIVS